MRKVSMFVLGACVVASGSVWAQDLPLSLTAGWAGTTPVIDGVVNLDEYTNAARISIDALDEMPPGITTEDSTLVGGPNGDGKQSLEDSSALVYIMNDGEFFYLGFDITDDVSDLSQPDNFRNDGVEIRIDSDNNDSQDREEGIDFYPTVLRDGRTGDFIAASEQAAVSEKADGTGFMMEYRVDASTFAEIIGFDVAINDSDDPAQQNRDTQYRWTGADDAAWNDPFKWGDLTLATGPGNGPMPLLISGAASSAPTLDGMMGDGEWDGAFTIYFDANDEIRPGVSTEDSSLVGGPFGDGKQTHVDSSAVVYIMNDDDMFYLAIDATDDVIDTSLADAFRNDGVEIRIDTDNNDSEDNEDSDIVLTILADSGLTEGDTYQVFSAVKPDSDGFVVEMSASMSVMSPVVGFDVAVNDSDDPNSQNRDTQYRIVGEDDAAWNDPFKWGDLILYSSNVDPVQWENY